MIKLTKGQTAESVIVTLNEKKTLSSGYFLFRFVHATTKDVVSIILSMSLDASSYPDRYNEFTINTQSYFGTKPRGQWWYEVYEQSSSSNTDTTGLTLLEEGIMKLLPSAEFSFDGYDERANFDQYDG